MPLDRSAAKVGDRIAKLIGAPPGSVVAADSTSINLYKALIAALKLAPTRKVILSDSGNFPPTSISPKASSPLWATAIA